MKSDGDDLPQNANTAVIYITLEMRFKHPDSGYADSPSIETAELQMSVIFYPLSN